MHTDSFSNERWLQFWANYKGAAHANPQQDAALIELKAAIDQADSSILVESAGWTTTWRTKPEATTSNPLTVPYFSQLDNASGEGYRECFSSSCAMLAAFHGKVSSDDEYNAIRAQYGDSTSSEAQLAALRALGLQADFFTNGEPADLMAEIDAGRPVATGWLHKGPVSAPTGGGHWTVVVGYTGSQWIHHDPNGEAALVGGGYTASTNGEGQHYSFQNWNPRWMPGGTGGWFLAVRP